MNGTRALAMGINGWNDFRVSALRQLQAIIAQCRTLLVLSGAGCSTASGIPDYRDASGAWKRRQPVNYSDFMRSDAVRRRYWARSFVGWPRLAGAAPNTAHHALAELERRGRVAALVTQNVDGLHQKAGSRSVIDLHGRIDAIVCTACGQKDGRAAFQDRLQHQNPHWVHAEGGTAPDGDVDLTALLGDVDYHAFEVPSCSRCGGVLKPDVVFFGETVPAARVSAVRRALEAADALLVVGSSLMVFSGYRFVRAANERGVPVAIVNQGRTRADDIAAVKVEDRLEHVLPALLSA